MATPKNPLSRDLSKLGRTGGMARLETMTEEEESARKAAQARWAKDRGQNGPSKQQRDRNERES